MIEIANARVTYGRKMEKPAIDRVNLLANDGERIIIVGSNGSGKTTLLRLLLGLVKAESGSVKVFGKNVAKIDGEVRVSTNLSEVYAIINTSVRDIIRIYSEMKGGEPSEPLNMVRTFGLDGILDRKIFQLSTGQRRMVANILALSFSPSLVLLDEPFDNIDQGTRIRLLKMLNNFNGGVVLNTHELDILNRLGDWTLYFMIEGKLIGKFYANQLKNLFLNKGDVLGSLAVLETSFGTFSITENSGQVPMANIRALDSMFDEVA
ncbi:MAG: ATP-binding cassette domain-containing protein [Thermoplasmataceae archaeon]